MPSPRARNCKPRSTVSVPESRPCPSTDDTTLRGPVATFRADKEVIARRIDADETIAIFDRKALLELVKKIQDEARSVPNDHNAVIKLIRQTLHLITEVVNHIEAREQAREQEDSIDGGTLADILDALERAGATDL